MTKYSPSFASRPTGQRGIALIGVLFGLTILALFAAGLVRDTRTEMLLTRNFLTTAKAAAAADAAVYRAIAEIAAAGSGGAGMETDGGSGETDTGANLARITTAIENEGGKIDLNSGRTDLLQPLLLQLGVTDAESLSDAIVDFRDADDSARENGAEWPAYRAAGLPHVAHNIPFRTVNELRLVLGMTEEIFQRLAPYVTVYSRRRGIDPRYAPEIVLRAIPGLGEDAIEDILAQRSNQEAVARPRGAYFNRTASRGFTIRAAAEMPDGGRFLRQAVIELTGRRGGYRVLLWQPGAAYETGTTE